MQKKTGKDQKEIAKIQTEQNDFCSETTTSELKFTKHQIKNRSCDLFFI